ncbi:MAG: hypothetical protein KDA92_12320, partial [Planctomycetales bacterium]|nr:hypothetical protein [Planctomycetales bacterium]
DTNRELSQMSAEELDQEPVRQQIARQAAAERANAQRLNGLTVRGEDLINQAMRNTEFNEDTLEKWARVLKVLKQLSQNNMPSVANRLSAAANAAKAGPPKKQIAPSVQDGVRGRPAEKQDEEESTQDQQEQNQKPRPSGSLQLPTTALPSSGKQKPQPPQPPSPAAQDVQVAVEEQEKLLAEFNSVMDELKQILQNLQGSTFVKRLKAAGDAELTIASSLHAKLPSSFGAPAVELTEAHQQMIIQLQNKQSDTSRDVRLIREDMSAYFDRTRLDAFKQVLDEMIESKVVRRSAALGDQMEANRAGLVIAQAEYWADQFDRWAEIIAGPNNANCSQCKGGPGDSLPPAIVLEVLRILKAEVDLREQTRVAEQSRPVVEADMYARAASELHGTQGGLHQRVQLVMDQLERLQVDEGKDYGKTLKQLRIARGAMSDAVALLQEPQTGPPTIAAETEAIEALLVTKRMKPGSGSGGGGASPGGGTGEGQAEVASALAGLGEQQMTESREVHQATGTSRANIPAEFQSGLDAYFSALDGQEGG